MKTKLKYICLSAAAGLTLSLVLVPTSWTSHLKTSMTKRQSGRMQI